ncbi:sugar ABC transporter ATP-binding protein [Pedosphaera parvula]|uniref:ABC transporter related-protein n=1 Tax=Pedosphaera parvula (strain Ellin514) TaxID=320771 RepID=B9XKJ0_PEDPL|nr:sugar ABC transporter ATP-binding protein [Pedosphaera parvula]EEF59660.1 ABC transporter related-protein [Pedosphaera parvula Ellin514]
MAYLAFQNINKRFPGVQALDQVSFEIERGSCHALIGENGAGKSTLGKILAGVYTADEGGMVLEGQPICPTNPLAARHLGIAMVHQELAFCPNLSVAENLCLGDLPRHAGWLDKTKMRKLARAMLAEIDCDINVDLPINELSTGQEQLVQIAAALGTKAQIIVMDEPTSSLSLHESENLFQLLAKLKERGITIIYVSHRMEELFRLCDHITVLRDGKHVSTEPIPATNPERVIQQMVGREVKQYTSQHLHKDLGEELLRVENLCSPGKFKDISFTLRAGEILGFAGLIGAGRSEVAQAIFGLDENATGKVFIHGKELALRSVVAALKMGIGLLPEDRKRLGLVLTMNCRENTSLTILNRLSKLGFVRQGQERSMVQGYVDRLHVKTPSIDAPVAGLSGGNQQKIALAKWLARQCKVLIVDEPTRGVDVGAKAEIHHLLDELACQGLALMVISSELPEVMNLSRRIIVMRQGDIAGELARQDFSQTNLMRLMAGIEAKAA